MCFLIIRDFLQVHFHSQGRIPLQWRGQLCLHRTKAHRCLVSSSNTYSSGLPSTWEQAGCYLDLLGFCVHYVKQLSILQLHKILHGFHDTEKQFLPHFPTCKFLLNGFICKLTLPLKYKWKMSSYTLSSFWDFLCQKQTFEEEEKTENYLG